MLMRFMAFLCRICPLCIAARKRPDSPFARFMRTVEKGCPFCRAYRESRRPCTRGGS